MNNSPFLTSTIATNSLGLVLLFVLFASNYHTIHHKVRERKSLLALFFIVLLGTLNEIVADIVNGLPGKAPFYLSYLSNSIGYLMVTLFACCILVFLRFHFFHIVSKTRFALAVFPILLALVAVIVNLFVPFLFKIDENNVYQRLNGYYFLLALDVLCLICSFFNVCSCIIER